MLAFKNLYNCSPVIIFFACFHWFFDDLSVTPTSLSVKEDKKETQSLLLKADITWHVPDLVLNWRGTTKFHFYPLNLCTPSDLCGLSSLRLQLNAMDWSQGFYCLRMMRHAIIKRSVKKWTGVWPKSYNWSKSFQWTFNCRFLCKRFHVGSQTMNLKVRTKIFNN